MTMQHQERKEKLKTLGYITTTEAAEILGAKRYDKGGVGSDIIKQLTDNCPDRLDIPLGETRKSSMWRKDQVLAYADRRVTGANKPKKSVINTDIIDRAYLSNMSETLVRVERKLDKLIAEWGLDEPNN